MKIMTFKILQFVYNQLKCASLNIKISIVNCLLNCLFFLDISLAFYSVVYWLLSDKLI